MPAIQTYQADKILPGYRAQRGDHKGTVLSTGTTAVPGTLSLTVFCETHQRPETWKNIPRHSAVHAERTL